MPFVGAAGLIETERKTRNVSFEVARSSEREKVLFLVWVPLMRLSKRRKFVPTMTGLALFHLEGKPEWNWFSCGEYKLAVVFMLLVQITVEEFQLDVLRE